jgi:ankyrin repeat protein
VSLAAYNNSVECLQLLVEGNAKIFQDKRGFTPLHHASLQGRDAVLQILLSHPQSIEKIDAKEYQEGNTALHLAAFKGSLVCIKQLIEYGSDPTILDSKGNSILHKACFKGAPSCGKMTYNFE